MKISKKDALLWFEFFASLPQEEELMNLQKEIVYGVFAQIEEAVNEHNDNLLAKIKGLKTLDGRTFFVGNEKKFPQGCVFCLTGSGLNAIRKTNKCNLQCRVCYDYGVMDEMEPIGEGVWEIGGTKFYEKDIDLLLHIQKKPQGISYVYLEPFMEIEKYYPVIKKFSDAGVHQHLYTNGVLASPESLQALGEAGLDEIRFNLGATDCSDSVIENMGEAKKHIKSVGVETPMTPEFFKSFFEKQQQILSCGLDFINCAELHLNENNIGNYADENMYISRHGYISPIWSRELTLKFMKIADDEHWDIAVHDCSNFTKFSRGLNLSDKEGGCFGQSSYACEFERIPYYAFLPILQDDNFKFITSEDLPKEYLPESLSF